MLYLEKFHFLIYNDSYFNFSTWLLQIVLDLTIEKNQMDPVKNIEIDKPRSLILIFKRRGIFK